MAAQEEELRDLLQTKAPEGCLVTNVLAVGSFVRPTGGTGQIMMIPDNQCVTVDLGLVEFLRTYITTLIQSQMFEDDDE
jgi:hypothetical protein